MKKKYFLFILLCSFFKAIATDYYVDPVNGDNSKNGLTSTTAFRSLDRIEAINLQPGDIVYFMEGTYTKPGQTLLTINESGNEENWITFKNYPNHKPTFEFDGWSCIELIGGSSYIKLEGLTIKGARTKVNLEDALNQPGGCLANFEGNPNGLYNGTGVLVVGPNLTWSNSATNSVPHHITINNCEVYDCTSSGVAFQQADYVTVTNNKIYDNCWYTTYGTSGINFYQFINTDETTGFHNEVSNNLVYGNQLLVPQIAGGCAYYDGNGFIIDDFNHTQTGNYKDASVTYEAYSAKTLISNNVAVENGGSGLHFYLSSNCYILNNTIANNAFQNDGDNGNGDLRIGISSDFVVKNNVIKGENFVHRNNKNTNIEYSYNYQYGPNIQNSLSGCEGCIEDIDIEFLNTDVNSIQPYITSFTGSLKDAGTLVENINNDYSYQPRPFGEGYDIGAYELTDEPLCELTTWYADTDEDGFGYENETVLACEQPEGYVSNNEDLCPNDPFKAEPGDCGCDIEEDTCDDNNIDDDLCNSPEYNNNTIYSTPGTIVIYNGNLYSNKWHASGLLPTSGGPWELIGFCDTTASDCSNIETWLSTNTYSNPGTQVVYNGFIYQNNWHISEDIPGISNAWELIGLCNTTSAKSIGKEVIKTEDAIFEVSVFNLAGQNLLTKKVNITNLNTISKTINVSSGMYILNIVNLKTGLKEIKKIIK